MRISLLTDPEDLKNYFEVYLPRMKREEFIGTLLHRISHAELMADAYRAPTSKLENLKQRVNAEWKELPFYDKILNSLVFLILPIADPRRKIRDEINFKNNGGTRSLEEWKQPFRNVADRYRREGLEEVATYVLDEVLPEYQAKHLTSV